MNNINNNKNKNNSNNFKKNIIKMNKRIIYIVGNHLVFEDNLPIRIVERLKERFKDIEFLFLDTVEEIEEYNPEIIDTVLEIDKVILIDNIDMLISSKTCTTHDFDLAMQLKLLKRVNKIGSIKIYGVPVRYDEEKAISELSYLINE